MMENDTQKSQQAASTALHNAPKLAKIAQAGVQGGPAGAATEAAVQYCKEILVVAIAVLLLPVLVLLMLPGAIFGTLTQPSTAVNDNLEVAANVMQLRNAVSDILQVAYEDTLAEIESERASLTYSDIDRFRGRSCLLQCLSAHFYVLRLPRRGRLYQNQPG